MYLILSGIPINAPKEYQKGQKNLPKPRKTCLKVAPNQRQSTPDIPTQKGFDLCFPSCS